MRQQTERYGSTSVDEGASDQITRRMQDLGEDALERLDRGLTPVGLSVKERPMTVLAVVSGVAFAAGALWMLRSSRQQSRYDALIDTVSDLPRRAGWR